MLVLLNINMRRIFRRKARKRQTTTSLSLEDTTIAQCQNNSTSQSKEGTATGELSSKIEESKFSDIELEILAKHQQELHSLLGNGEAAAALQLMHKHMSQRPQIIIYALSSVCAQLTNQCESLSTHTLLGLLDVACHAGVVITSRPECSSYMHHVEQLEHEALVVGSVIEKRLVSQTVRTVNSQASEIAAAEKNTQKPSQSDAACGTGDVWSN